MSLAISSTLGSHTGSAIQQALGHQNIDQTMGYVHASDSAPREALERLGLTIQTTSEKRSVDG